MHTPIGVTVHQRADLLDHVSALGLRIARIDANVYDIRPGPHEWNWGWLDTLIDGCVARGITPYPVLSYTPHWQGTRNMPPNIYDWTDLVQAFGERYQGRVTWVAAWNEPNSPGLFAGSVEQYVRQVLEPMWHTLRAIDQRYRVCGPELSTQGDWSTWLLECLRLGCSYLDVLTIHSYERTGYAVMNALTQDRYWWIPQYVPWPKPSVRQVMRWAGCEEMPLGLTEFGWSTAKISEAQQATYYDQFLSQLDSAQLTAAVSFNLINESEEVQWGLLRENRTEKAAAQVMRGYTTPGRV